MGLRYENAGQPIQDLLKFNDPVFAASETIRAIASLQFPDVIAITAEPRLGFNWNLRTSSDGFIGAITGGDRLVLRGGYTRTHDYAYTNIALNIWSSFPFVSAFNLTNVPNALCHLLKPAGQPGDLYSYTGHAGFPFAGLRLIQS